jgi:hypothetical protein
MSDAGGGQVTAEHAIALLTTGLSFLGCMAAFRRGYEPGTFGEFQVGACLIAAGAGGFIAALSLAGLASGTVAAIVGLLGDVITLDWPGVFGG